MNTFTMTGKTDAETLAVIRSIAPAAANGDASAVAAVMTLGLATGRITEVIGE